MSERIAEAGDVSIDIDELCLQFKLGSARSFLEEIVCRKIAAAMAVQRGLVAPDEEIDQALADLFAELDLFEPPQIQSWLAAEKVDEALLRAHVRDQLLWDKLRTTLITDAIVKQRFAASPYDFAKLHIQKITLPSQGAAAEVLLQLNEVELTWEEAARQAGGMESFVAYRKDAPAEAAAQLFVSPLGSFVGSAEEAESGYAIYRIVWRAEPKLDDALIEEIRAELYAEELHAALVTKPLKFLR